MAKFKVVVCDCCEERIIYPEKTTWRHIFKIARRFGWVIGNYQLCPDCRKKMADALAKENEHDGE